jgi:carbonic anhydrase
MEDVAERLNVTVEENVLAQLQDLRTHPTVAAALRGGSISLHGWVYKIETGRVLAFDAQDRQFHPIERMDFSTPSSTSDTPAS